MVNYIFFNFETALTTAHQLNKLVYPEAYKTAQGKSKRTLHDDIMVSLVTAMLLDFAREHEE
jgi:hypothetical protein